MAYKEIDESNITLIDSVSSFIEMIKQVKGKYVIIRICQQLYFSDTLFS